MDKKKFTSWGVSFGSLALVAGMVSYLGLTTANKTANANVTTQTPSASQDSSQQSQSLGGDNQDSFQQSQSSGGDNQSSFRLNRLINQSLRRWEPFRYTF